MMYIVRDTERTFAYDLFFVSCVILGTFVILNLMIAVQASYLDQAFDAEDNRQNELKEKMDLKRKLQQEQEDNEMEDLEDEEHDHHHHEEVEAGEGHEHAKRKIKAKEKKPGVFAACAKKP